MGVRAIMIRIVCELRGFLTPKVKFLPSMLHLLIAHSVLFQSCGSYVLSFSRVCLR